MFVIRWSQASRCGQSRLAAALGFAVATGLAACARDAPPSIPVTVIFDASPNCGGADGGSDGAEPDAAAPGDAPVADPSAAPPPKFARDCQPGRLRPVTLGRPGTPKAKVLVVSVDGLRPDAIFHAPAPNLHALACQGAYSWRARTIEPSMTLPSHASMVSGFPPEQHGIFHNDLQPGTSRSRPCWPRPTRRAAGWRWWWARRRSSSVSAPGRSTCSSGRRSGRRRHRQGGAGGGGGLRLHVRALAQGRFHRALAGLDVRSPAPGRGHRRPRWAGCSRWCRPT